MPDKREIHSTSTICIGDPIPPEETSPTINYTDIQIIGGGGGANQGSNRQRQSLLWHHHTIRVLVRKALKLRLLWYKVTEHRDKISMLLNRYRQQHRPGIIQYFDDATFAIPSVAIGRKGGAKWRPATAATGLISKLLESLTFLGLNMNNNCDIFNYRQKITNIIDLPNGTSERNLTAAARDARNEAAARLRPQYQGLQHAYRTITTKLLQKKRNFIIAKREAKMHNIAGQDAPSVLEDTRIGRLKEQAKHAYEVDAEFDMFEMIFTHDFAVINDEDTNENLLYTIMAGGIPDGHILGAIEDTAPQKCPICCQYDTRIHVHFGCPGLQQVYREDLELNDLDPNFLPPCLANFGIAPRMSADPRGEYWTSTPHILG